MVCLLLSPLLSFSYFFRSFDIFFTKGRTMSDCDHYGMFACDGLCYPMSAKCDYTYDCKSGMDEEGCIYGKKESL